MKKYILIGFAIMFMTGCVATRSPSPKPVVLDEIVDIRLPVGYIPNVQFAPLYVAIEKGYFATENIHVTLDYSFETDAVALLGAGELQFAIASGEQVLLARAQEIPIVYVLAWYQKYPVAVASKAGHKILQPDDLMRKSIGIPVLSGASYIGLKTILDAGGLTEEDVVLETIGFNQVEMLATDQVEAVVVYVANEPVVLESQGYPVNLIRVDDYLELVSNGLVTNENTISENPDLVKRMVRAILKGISDTIANPEGAYQISEIYVETLETADEDIQMQVLSQSIELWKGPTLGFSDKTAWSNMLGVLRSMGLLKKDIDVSQAFTNEYLP